MVLKFVRILPIWIILVVNLEAGFWSSLFPFWCREGSSSPKVDLLIVHDQAGVMLEIRGKHQIYDPNTKQYLCRHFVGKRKYLEPMASGIKWGEEFPGIYQLHIIPDRESTLFVVDGTEYRGTIVIYDVGGTISIVNRVEIEDYIQDLLVPRFSDLLPKEALSAVAIACRTNAYYSYLHPQTPYWAIDAKKVGYEGAALDVGSNAMKCAIHATSYMVLSRTGTYEGVLTPFLADWNFSKDSASQNGRFVLSQISLKEVEELANKGDDAAQILSKAYPKTHIELIP